MSRRDPLWGPALALLLIAAVTATRPIALAWLAANGTTVLLCCALVVVLLWMPERRRG